MSKAQVRELPRLPRRADFVSFSGVTKIFGEAMLAVRDINLTVAEGEFITIVGPSGCGKSTLLNMTAGLFGPTEGSVAYGGKPVEGINTSVGYMTQTDHLMDWRTIARNVALPLEIRRKPKALITETVKFWLEAVGLTGFENSYPTQLSGGMRKRAALARLLAYDPETLLMDEPFGALDAQLRLTLQTELRQLCRRLGKTVLFVTHDIDEAIALGDRCVVFTERPGHIREIIEVNLPRDRDLRALRGNADYLAECHRLWELLAPAMEAQTALEGKR
ncbi:MAG TPA: ABC transporter ATP-binding protein [Devosiaceae bacterium]